MTAALTPSAADSPGSLARHRWKMSFSAERISAASLPACSPSSFVLSSSPSEVSPLDVMLFAAYALEEDDGRASNFSAKWLSVPGSALGSIAGLLRLINALAKMAPIAIVAISGTRL